jgi:hypothetical protein
MNVKQTINNIKDSSNSTIGFSKWFINGINGRKVKLQNGVEYNGDHAKMSQIRKV